MDSMLRKFFLFGSLAFGASSTMALTTPAIPPAAAPSPDPANIMVHPPVLLGGQWFDSYFRTNPGGLDGQAVSSANCVVVFYHGGGFYGGNPRDAADPEMVKHFVKDRGCILLMASYSVNPSPGTDADNPDPASRQFTISQIVGDMYTDKSVFGSFNALYTQHLQAWMQLNPNLKLWTSGGSAGTILAQRVAASGNWPISNTLLFAPVVKNPSYHGYTVPNSNVSISNPLGFLCEGRMRNAGDCPNARFVWGYNSYAWTPSAEPNDLSYYAASTPSNLQTEVIINACDEVADLGSFMRGYFNLLNPSKRRISVAKGNSIQQIKDHLQIGSDDRGYKSGQHATPGIFTPEYYQNYTGTSNPSSKWAVFNATSLPEIESQYIKYCDTGVQADTELFRSYLIN